MPDSSYRLLDFGHSKRLEQWGTFRLVRPDPVAHGLESKPELWDTADATYEGEKGKGQWVTQKQLPPEWAIELDDVKMIVRLAPYKHTGVFPEQESNWRWMRDRAHGRPLQILNLFAYTGGATMALAKDGHFVTHVDASKPTITWAKENAELNKIPTDRIRWMLEDAAVFAARELKRGKKYDAIILDPPAYGHGPSGKAWRVERDLAPLLERCAQLLSDTPAFIVLNGYAQNDTPESFHRLLTGIVHAKTKMKKFSIDARELTLGAADGRLLSTGITARCAFP
jgi:23S rRNA (cytosine1962-C5)-methyltransferase